jgi:hypothetical protein
MAKYATRPFIEALGEILRERYGDKLGRYPLAPFISKVGKRTGLSHEYIRLMLIDQRPLRTDVVEAVAAELGVDPHYFVEYRSAWVKKQMEENPDLSAKVYDFVVKLMGLENQKDAAAARSENGEVKE